MHRSPNIAPIFQADRVAWVGGLRKKGKYQKNKKKRPQIESVGDAEEERFELPVPFSTTVFKTAPLNRSGIPP